MSLRCYILDDEPLAIRVLEKYIAQTPALILVGTATSALEALVVLPKNNIDLLFLDINMPALSGIGLARTLTKPPLLVFTTAYAEYAVEGFELEALDYLVKPFSFERFLKTVNKAIIKYEAKDLPTHLVVKADRRLYHIRLEDILFIEAYGDYVKIHTRHQVLVPKETLNSVEERLPAAQFLRVHRSYLIAMDAVEFIEGNLIQIGKSKIPIGQSFREILLEKINKS